MEPQTSISTRICGFGNRFQKTESLWSIGSKLCWANLSTATTLITTCGENPLSNPVRQVLVGSSLILAALSRSSGIPIEVLRDGTLMGLHSYASARLVRMAYTRLRFCPGCLSHGFHSVLFQIPIFPCCPVHNTRLLERCTNCGNEMPYRWPRKNEMGFTCYNCGHVYWNPTQLTTGRSDNRTWQNAQQVSTVWVSERLRLPSLFSEGLQRFMALTAQWAAETPDSSKIDDLIWAAEANGHWANSTVIPGDSSECPRISIFQIYQRVFRLFIKHLEATPAQIAYRSPSERPFDGEYANRCVEALIQWRSFWERSGILAYMNANKEPVRALQVEETLRTHYPALNAVFDEQKCAGEIWGMVFAEMIFEMSLAFALTNALKGECRALCEAPVPVVGMIKAGTETHVCWVNDDAIAHVGLRIFKGFQYTRISELVRTVVDHEAKLRAACHAF